MTLRPHAHVRRTPSHSMAFALRPLALALFAAFPAAADAQAAIARPAPPAPSVVPRPATVWRTSGTGANLPVNTVNKSGGTDQVIHQSSTGAIYNWQSFDVGSASSVTFNLPTSSSSALNRVTGSAAPSQIFGRLTSQVANADPTKAPSVGGSIYLINANGVLFGRSAQVNVGSLVASTLNLKDADYLDNLTSSVAGTGASFAYDPGSVPSLFTDATNFVMVDPGATITTASGGRVFLFAKNVQNGGSISAPDGQVALAGGQSVYLENPTAETIYASEANPNYPVVRGLLVEVGGTGVAAGSASNLVGGTIDTARGNTTLVGLAVNQMGRISATTSVSQNGSVFLLARGGAVDGSASDPTKRAAVSGALTLGSGSRVEIAPDTTPGADGKPVTSDGNSIFTASRVEMAGKTISFASGAAVVAHGGVVNVRAEGTPDYRPDGKANFDAFDGDDAARIVVGDDVTLDVSGTTDATVSAARNYVTTQLLGKSDLKDAPLQKDGPLYRGQVTFDVRAAVPILGDTGVYQTGIKRDATERLAAGGSLVLSSTGAVVAASSSTLDVSGGKVNYTQATATPTTLVAANGASYTMNNAPKDVVYTAIVGAGAATQDRWGIVPQAVPAQAITVPGYVDGRAGGTLTVSAPHTILDGHIAATTTAGVRQTAGLDALSGGSTVNLGLRANLVSGLTPTAFGSTGFVTSALDDLAITARGDAMPASFWADPLGAAVPATSRIAASTITASGVGKLVITADGGIAIQRGADLSMTRAATLDLAAGGNAGIVMAGDVRSEGGTVSARTRDVGSVRAGGITLAAGTDIDVSGEWVNRKLDGATVIAATAGGRVTLSSARDLTLADASRIDVSGGATVSTAGVVAGTSGGSITLESDQKRIAGQAPSSVHLGATLVDQALVTGGTLALHGMDQVRVGNQALPSGVQDGAQVGSLELSAPFFNHGAFASYDLQAVSGLAVQPSVRIAPQARNWIVTSAAANVASGTPISSVLAEGVLLDSQRSPVSLNLSAVTPFGIVPAGDVRIGAGASIVTDPLASVTVKAGRNLDLEGRIAAPGGKVALSLVDGAAVNAADNPVAGSLVIGPRAAIDVSGVSVRQPLTGATAQGNVLDGGSVSLSVTGVNARLSPVNVAAGAVISADGASDTLGVTTTNASGSTSTTLRDVDSRGGSISIGAEEGGAVIDGALHAHGGGDAGAAGSFALSLTGVRSSSSGVLVDLVDNYAIVVQSAPVTQATAVNGVAQLSADSLAAGFANVSLSSRDRIRFLGDVALNLAGNITLDAPLIAASPQSRSVGVQAGGALLLGGTPAVELPTATTALPGDTPLSLKGALVEFYGSQALQGFHSVAATGSDEIRLAGVASASQQGTLSLRADLTLSAPQVDVTSGSSFTIAAPGQRVLLTGGDRASVAPMSAGGSITVDAADITTVDPSNASAYGVLRAPLGQIALNASDAVVIGNGSDISVSGLGQTVLYGTTVNGQGWSYDNHAVIAPTAKSVTLSAPSVDVRAGATIDNAGGGTLRATEFVAGPGGSTDIFAGAANGAYAIVPTVKGFAPQDFNLALDKDASGAIANVALGRTITIGAGGPVPAGTYALLPARYALLSGAFLVKPVTSSAPLALGATVARPDGSVLVGGQYGSVGVGATSSTPQTFQLLDSKLAQAFSQVNTTDADTYFTAQANAAGTPVPRLPQDAGRLAIAAQRVSLKGTSQFAVPKTGGAGGELDLSADRVQIGGDASAAAPGTLALSVADLNTASAALLVIGGSRSADGRQLNVGASSVTLDNDGVALKGGDIVLVARDSVELQAGASIAASPSGASSASDRVLNLSGDGALVRVSADPAASTVRGGVLRATGDLAIDAGASLVGGAVTAEATHSTAVAPDASFKATAITLGASRIAIGEVDPAQVSPATLSITPTLGVQLGSAQSLTLRSFDGVDFRGNATLGGSSLKSLTVDSGALRLVGANANATIAAGGITLLDSSGSATDATPGTGRLMVQATGAAGGSGQIVIGPGSTSVAGAATTTLAATNELLVSGQSQLRTPGDLALSGSALQATAQADAALQAAGTLSLTSGGGTATAPAGSGAHLALSGASIEQSGRIALPAGQLTLLATTGDVHLASAAVVDLAGRDKTLDGVTVSTSGGGFQATAATGNVRIDTGSSVDVSAGSSGGGAGSISMVATNGGVSIGGSLAGVARPGQAGGQLAIDSGHALDLDALQAAIAARAGNFTQAISLRNRTGDETLSAGGAGFSANRVTLQADAGSLTIAGAIDASRSSGGTIVLAAGDTLTIAAGADITAHGTGNVGGQVQLMAGRVAQDADGALVGNGRIRMDGGVIDVGAASGGVAGNVLLRAQRTDDGQDVRIDQAAGATGTAIASAGSVQVEAVRQYQADTIDGGLIAQVNADNLAFAGSGGANATRIVNRVGGLLSGAAPVQLRAGIEVDQLDPGVDLVMTGNAAMHGWNLARFDAFGQALQQPTGAPLNLTLRAAGNLAIQGSISDGFVPAGATPTSAAAASVISPTAVAAQAGGTIRLVGGADLGAANVMSTRASPDAGDVVIGNGGDVIVRTTTGDIAIAAGRDVVLTDHQAVVYTTGLPVAGPGYVGLASQSQSLLKAGSGAQSPTLVGGGSVDVAAQRDVTGAGALDFDGQYASEWLWRGTDATANGQATWWARYDRFKQGFATFGGGNMTVAAGRDAVDVEAAAASSGYIARDAQGNVAGLRRQGGGDLSLSAGRDIVDGQVLEDAGTLAVRSGRDIVASPDAPAALQVLHGASRVDIEARNDAAVGLVTAFGLVSDAPQAFPTPAGKTLAGTANGATLRMVAGSGDLAYLGVATTDNFATAASASHSTSTGTDKIVPDVALFAAPAGSVSVGTVVQVSGSGTTLNVLASKDVVLASALTVAGTDARQASPTLLVDGGSLVGTPFGLGLTPYDQGHRDPVHIVAETGDVKFMEAVDIVKPLRVLAGRDITIGQNIEVQHQADAELSLLQAGRDVDFTVSSVSTASLKVQGPGDLVVEAGRNVDLNTSGGLGATGNRENALLPARSATLTVLAGVALGQGDYAGAIAGWFPILGGTGVAGYAPDLVAQLEALQSGAAAPGVGSAAAIAFKSAPIADQIAKAKSLVGASAFDAAVLADARRRQDAQYRADPVKNAPASSIDLATAQTRFAALGDADKTKVVGTALATAWAAGVPQAEQSQSVLAWVDAQGKANTSATDLPAFIARETGRTGLTLADAMAAFEALAPERQVVYTNQVLLATIRDAGKQAAALAGDERTAAYAKAYDALAVVFPAAGNDGGVDMGSSQLRTYQGSDIDVLTPRGGVNVGALASTTTPKSASDTGIVTGAGGNISMTVRDDVNVNQSRVFTVGKGDLLIWSSDGNIDAGRGAKTVTGAPPPVFRFDSSGNFVLDTSGSYSGSGIAVLDAGSNLYLFAPVGEINAGDAGIKSLGNAFLGAARFVGADNLSIGGTAVGAPPVASAGGETAGLAAASQSVSAATHVDSTDSEDEKERKRRKRLNLILDFLGFGEGAAK